MPKKMQTCSPPEVSFNDVRKVHPALRNYLGYCLHKTTTIFRAEVNSAFEKHDIQGHHIAILSVIAANNGEINQIKLCDETGIDKASMVKIVDHIEKLGYIQRVNSQKDRRVKKLSVTKRGSLFLKKGQQIRGEIESRFLSALNKNEIETFKKLLLRILDHQQSL